MAETIAARPLTAELAHHALESRTAIYEDDVIRAAKHCLLDWCAVALAAIDEPVSVLLRTEYANSSRGDVTVLGADKGFSAADAALVNGATSHALDYDDVHPLVGHPSVAILPAVLAVAEEVGASGEDALNAFVAGYDAAVFVGSIVMPSHYDRGFHSTATVGSFGAAVGAGLLLGLDEERMRVALGVAGTEAAGLKCMFGTMAKPFHAGRAAANGVVAARLARAGFTANVDVIETEQGFARTQSEFGMSQPRTIEFQTGRVRETLFKYHAACYLTHSSIEAIKQIKAKSGVRPDDVAELDIFVPRGHLKVCNIAVPTTGLELKFSLAQLAAGAMTGIDTAAIATYSDAVATDPAISGLRARIKIHGDRKAGMSSEVRVRTNAGAVHEATVDTGIPDPDLEHQERNLRRKFHSLADPVVGVERAARLQEAIENFDRASNLSGVTKLLRAAVH